MQAEDVKKTLSLIAKEEKAMIHRKFFKTGKGEYGEGDSFIGVTVPEQRAIAKKFKELKLSEVKKMLMSSVHEHRLTALIIMMYQYKGNEKKIYDFYLAHTKHVNNWDLVDISAHKIIGTYLLDKKRDMLYTLSEGTLWEKRIAIVATFAFIRKKEYKDTFKLAEQYLIEEHDLMHKATGWMLREVGKNSGEEILENFLKKHYKKMPRTMLRYSIEKFNEEKRMKYLKGKI